MAGYTAESVVYYLSLPQQHLELLGSIRNWENVKIAFEDDTVWIKDLDSIQLDSIEIKSIPYKHIFYARENKLFPKDSILPARNIPSLLWSPVNRGIPVELPALNHNYFEIQEKVAFTFIESSKEEPPFAMITSLVALEQYLDTAPAIRIQNLLWVIVGENALLIGSPLLPLQGEVYWRNDSFLIPAGWEMEYPVLAPTMNRLINPNDDHWIVWSADGNYSVIPLQSFASLSLSSFRLSKKQLHG